MRSRQTVGEGMEFASAGVTCILSSLPTSVFPQTKALGISPPHPALPPTLQLSLLRPSSCSLSLHPKAVKNTGSTFSVCLKSVKNCSCKVRLGHRTPGVGGSVWLDCQALHLRSPLSTTRVPSLGMHSSSFNTHARATRGNQSESRGRKCLGV